MEHPVFIFLKNPNCDIRIWPTLGYIFLFWTLQFVVCITIKHLQMKNPALQFFATTGSCFVASTKHKFQARWKTTTERSDLQTAMSRMAIARRPDFFRRLVKRDRCTQFSLATLHYYDKDDVGNLQYNNTEMQVNSTFFFLEITGNTPLILYFRRQFYYFIKQWRIQVV